MGQTTLAQAARGAGYSTVIVGKKGPAAIQWLSALDSNDDNVGGPLGVFIDDATNHPAGIDKMPSMSTILHGDLANDAFAVTGAGAPPFTTTPNLTQQAWLLSLTTQSLIPSLKESGKPFVLLFWSRDPDATQHGADGQRARIVPGINSSMRARRIYNADNNLKGILDALKQWGLADNTDIFVTADHGFSTIAKGIPTAGRRSGASARCQRLRRAECRQVARRPEGVRSRPRQPRSRSVADGEHPANGERLHRPVGGAPRAIVAANGGTDFMYVSERRRQARHRQAIFAKLLEQPYVGALFVNDELLKSGNQGTLPARCR